MLLVKKVKCLIWSISLEPWLRQKKIQPEPPQTHSRFVRNRPNLLSLLGCMSSPKPTLLFKMFTESAQLPCCVFVPSGFHTAAPAVDASPSLSPSISEQYKAVSLGGGTCVSCCWGEKGERIKRRVLWRAFRPEGAGMRRTEPQPNPIRARGLKGKQQPWHWCPSGSFSVLTQTRAENFNFSPQCLTQYVRLTQAACEGETQWQFCSLNHCCDGN